MQKLFYLSFYEDISSSLFENLKFYLEVDLCER